MSVSRKATTAIKWFLVIGLIFSSLFLFNYARFKGNDGMFFLNALDSDGGEAKYLGFDVDSLSGVVFGATRSAGLRKEDSTATTSTDRLTPILPT